MATIDEINKAYTKENKLLERLTAPGGLKDKIAQFELDLAQQIREYKVKKADLELAESKKDKATIDILNRELEEIKNQVFEIRNKIVKSKDFLDKQQQTVDDKFAELSKDPEVKQKLDAILYKKYDRKRKQEVQKKQQLETIKSIVDAHPTIQSWLKGIEGYEKSIKKCNKILDKYAKQAPKTPEEQKELADAKSEKAKSEKSLADRKNDLTSYFAKNHPEIDKNILNDIHSYSNISRQIAGCEKSINNHTKAMDSLNIDQYAKSKAKKEESSYESVEQGENSLTPVPAEKPSWLHPIKRLKYMLNERKAKGKNAEAEMPEKRSNFLDSVKLSKDEYNSEVVQKYLNEKYTEILHNSTRPKDNDSNER